MNSVRNFGSTEDLNLNFRFDDDEESITRMNQGNISKEHTKAHSETIGIKGTFISTNPTAIQTGE